MGYMAKMLALCLAMFFCSVCDLKANELMRGKVVEMAGARLIIRLPNGQKESIYLNSETKFMHKPGSGEQSAPPIPRVNDKVAVSLQGRTAAFVVVEEIPK